MSLIHILSFLYMEESHKKEIVKGLCIAACFVSIISPI